MLKFAIALLFIASTASALPSVVSVSPNISAQVICFNMAPIFAAYESYLRQTTMVAALAAKAEHGSAKQEQLFELEKMALASAQGLKPEISKYDALSVAKLSVIMDQEVKISAQNLKIGTETQVQIIPSKLEHDIIIVPAQAVELSLFGARYCKLLDASQGSQIDTAKQIVNKIIYVN